MLVKGSDTITLLIISVVFRYFHLNSLFPTFLPDMNQPMFCNALYFKFLGGLVLFFFLSFKTTIIKTTRRLLSNFSGRQCAKIRQGALKQLVEQHYKEPVNGQFEDCTKEVLPGMETESSREEDQNITTE